MSATDKEQHTDTEKPTDVTESVVGSGGCRNEKDRPRARSMHTVDSSVGGGHGCDRTVNLSSTMSSDNTCSSDVASSSDHTPATIESPAYDYFQSMSRFFAGSMEVFQDDYDPFDSNTSRLGMSFVGGGGVADSRLPNIDVVESSSSSHMQVYNRDQLSPISTSNVCGCGDVSTRCVDCPCRQQQPEQHVKDDALMRSDSFDTSAASIGSVATIPDSMVYDLSDEAADAMSSDELAESHCASVGDHRSVYSPTALSFDGGAASDYYSSDPECAAVNAVAAAASVTATATASAAFPAVSSSSAMSTSRAAAERRRPLHSKYTQKRAGQENISTSFDDHEFLHPPQVYPNDDETEREISLFLEKTYCLGAGSSSNNVQQSDTYLSPKLSYHTAASSSTSGHFPDPAAAAFERENYPPNPSGTNQTCNSRSSSAQNHHWNQASRFSTPPPLKRSSEVMTLPAPSPSGATAPINSNHLGFPQAAHQSMTLKTHGVIGSVETPMLPPSTSTSPRDIDLKFRLMQSYTIWYLPKVTRQKAIEYLHNRQPGNFIVRHSSRPGTMALSLRSTNNSEEENLVEHFLIINTALGLQINEAEQSFVDIVSLLQHYHEMVDGLPCKLRLPKIIERATRLELTQFWFTGERFWHQPINSEFELDSSAAGGSNSDDVASDPATDPATLGRTTIRTASCEDDLEDPFGSSSSVCLDPPKIPPKTDEIRQLIKQDMESKILSSSSSHNCSSTTSTAAAVVPASTASNFETLDKLREYAPPDMLDGGGDGGSSGFVPNNSAAILYNPGFKERKTSDKHHSVNSNCHINSAFVGSLNLTTLESELQSPKATPSDSGYDTSSRNVFESKLFSQKRFNNELPGLCSRLPLPYSESFSRSCPSNDVKEKSTREHKTVFEPSPINSSNPFTFPESNEEESLCKMWNNSSGGGGGSFMDYPQCSRHQGASAKINCNVNRISAGAFSDDTSILSSDSMILSSNNPFKNLISQPAGVNRGHSHIRSSELHGATGANHQPKYNSSENFSAANNITVTTTATPVTASSCESIRSVNQSERSSSSSILASSKVLSGLYDRGRSKFCDAPSHVAMSPNSFGNWFLGTPDLKSSPVVTNDAPTLPLKKNPNTVSLENDNNSPSESQEDHPLAQSSAAYLLNNVNSTAASAACNARANRQQKKHPYIRASWKVPRIWAYLRRRGKNSSTKIRDCIMNLANDPNSNFSRLIKNTVDKYAKENDQSVLLNQVRSEMNSLKYYLQSPNEKSLSDLIDRERAKLRDNEFLNMDVITEDALYRTVLKQLYVTIMTSLIDHHRSNGNLEKMQTNLRIAKSKSFRQLGIPSRLTPPKGDHLLTVKFYFKKMCCTYSPTAKMDCLLAASKTIYNSVEVGGGTLKASTSMGAEEFLPMLIYCLAQYNFLTVEVETQYIWAFLPPHMQTREPGYYLTALSSAAYILKNMPPHASWTPTSPMFEANASEFQRKELALSDSATPRRSPDCYSTENVQGGNVGSHQLPSIADIQGFLKIVVPDEKMESIISKTLPVPPGMSATDVCGMLAHKLKISHNPDVYGLYVVVDGKEDRIEDEECPQQVKAKLIALNKRYLFAYKRLKAHIIWPNTTNNSPPSTLNGGPASPTPPAGSSAATTKPTSSCKINNNKSTSSNMAQNLSPKSPNIQSNFVELPPPQKTTTNSASFTARSISKLGAFGTSVSGSNPTRGRPPGHSASSPQPRYAVDNTYVPSTCNPASPEIAAIDK